MITIARMGDVFIGSEAVALGRLTKSGLRRQRALFRDVYMPKLHSASLRDRTIRPRLWSRRRAVVAGLAASALHGAQWLDADAPIELIAPNARRQPGVVVRNETLRPIAFLDMGWEEFKVAAEYDGDQHRSDRRQYVKDIRRREIVDELGWQVVRVVAEDRPVDIIDRVYNALRRRGYRRDRR
jgi:hypothetical protein